MKWTDNPIKLGCNMIEKWYEVTCDYCGKAVNHYIGNKPNKNELIEDGFFVYKKLIFCDKECFKKWKSEFCPPNI